MTTPALKLNVLVCFPAHGGNGGISSEVPDIREWWGETLLEMKRDPRVGEVTTYTLGDTPVTMVRNRFVLKARERGAHLLLMVDSDQHPNKHRTESWFKPLWGEAFNAIYEHYGKGPMVVGSPYCGPPGGIENVYVFYCESFGNRGSDTHFKLEQYPRQVAVKMRGVQEVAALPTGMILYDIAGRRAST